MNIVSEVISLPSLSIHLLIILSSISICGNSLIFPLMSVYITSFSSSPISKVILYTTSISLLASLFSELNFIVTLPLLIPVTNPFSETVATLSSLLDHIKVSLKSVGSMTAIILILSPTQIVSFSDFNSILVIELSLTIFIALLFQTL